MLLAANSMRPSALRVAALPLSHLCLVKIVPSIVVIVSRPSEPLVPPAGMIAATVAVVTMEAAAAAAAAAVVVAVVAVAAAVVVAMEVVIAVAVGNTGHLMLE